MEDEYKDENEFTNYIMYKICPKNKDSDCCYIGHTTNFIKRQKDHITNTVSINDKKHYHLKHYETIRQTGGWDNWEMIELEKFNAKTKLEARMREQELIEIHNATLNSLRAYVSEEEKATIKKNITQKYRENNKELIKTQLKQYKADHKEVISEQMKLYRETNKEKIKEQQREYVKNNQEKHDETQKKWRDANKESSKEKRKLYDAKKREERLLANPIVVITEEEKAAKKMQQREKYNENRRQKKLQDKEQSSKE